MSDAKPLAQLIRESIHELEKSIDRKEKMGVGLTPAYEVGKLKAYREMQVALDEVIKEIERQSKQFRNEKMPMYHQARRESYDEVLKILKGD